MTLTSVRGRTIDLPDGGVARATIHPSFLLRMPDRARSEQEYALFVADLNAAAE